MLKSFYFKNVLRVRRYFFSRFFVNRTSKKSKIILILSSGRSGSTWLQSLVNHQNKFRLIFEPFNFHNSSFSFGDFSRKFFDETSTLVRHLESVIYGEARDAWMDVYNKKFFTKNRVIKDINSNQLLGTFYNKFPNIKILYLVRDPFEVAFSRVRLGWHKEKDLAAKTDFSSFTKQDVMKKNFKQYHLDLIEKYKDNIFLNEILFWCFDNYVSYNFYKSKANDIKLVSYNKLRNQPEKYFEEISVFIGETVNVFKLNHLIMKPSATAAINEKNSSDIDNINLSKEDILEAHEIINSFNLTDLFKAL